MRKPFLATEVDAPRSVPQPSLLKAQSIYPLEAAAEIRSVRNRFNPQLIGFGLVGPADMFANETAAGKRPVRVSEEQK
jgi:hypothetical protein